jgi:hypothetical protein
MSAAARAQGRWRCVLAEPGQAAFAAALSPTAWEDLAAQGSGTLVKMARTSWVQRVQFDAIQAYCKTYVYPAWSDRRRGWLRSTWLARSRAHREADALRWLRCHGFLAPAPLAVAEDRRLGVLRAAVLVTEAIDAPNLTDLLPTLTSQARAALLAALREFVRSLHRAGFRDRNLDPRNILVVGAPDAPRFAKIDSPRYHLRRPGRTDDALAAADWRRLDAGLAALDPS